MTKNAMEKMEEVRALAEQIARDDDPLDFYSAARNLGLSDRDAEALDIHLTERIMTARGLI